MVFRQVTSLPNIPWKAVDQKEKSQFGGSRSGFRGKCHSMKKFRLDELFRLAINENAPRRGLGGVLGGESGKKLTS